MAKNSEIRNDIERAAIIFLLIMWAWIPTAAHATSVNLSEDWFVKISNFSLDGGGDIPGPFSVHLKEFVSLWSVKNSTTPLIEPKLQNPILNQDGHFARLIFDFHDGQASTDDVAQFCPCCTIGSIWGGTMSFDWQIFCTNPRIIFTVDADDPMSGGQVIFWHSPAESGYGKGRASFSVGTVQGNPPTFRVAFAPVPEPTTFATLLIPLSILGMTFATKRPKYT